MDDGWPSVGRCELVIADIEQEPELCSLVVFSLAYDCSGCQSHDLLKLLDR